MTINDLQAVGMVFDGLALVAVLHLFARRRASEITPIQWLRLLDVLAGAVLSAWAWLSAVEPACGV